MLQADTLDIFSDDANAESSLGKFTGMLTYTQVTSRLRLEVKNTSPVANGGFITGVVLNIHDVGNNATASFIEAASAFEAASASDLDFNPFGVFEFGVHLQGNPNNGIGVGDTGVFEFNVTDPENQGLTVMDFFSEISPGNGANGKDYSFAVRFRGFIDDGSDKVPGSEGPPPPPPTGGTTVVVVPLPASALMGFAMIGGMACVSVLRRRLR